ncbi:MAG TPA: hypothetical protein VMR98_01635 [Candidatus Polarisedimenticolaceae bacterium]|nr:hypothetical protein [Candidatus Polarisedimenticolaceae bacterium]
MPLSVQADDAAMLGPQGSLGSGVGSGVGNTSDPQTGSLLQPAGASSSSSPLQSADAGAGGIATPETQTLQQTGPADDIKVLMAKEGEGRQPLRETNDLSWIGWVFVILGLAIAITVPLVRMERRRNQRAE